MFAWCYKVIWNIMVFLREKTTSSFDFFFFGRGRGDGELKKKKKKLFCVLILRDACELGIAMSLYFPRGIQKPGLEYAAINLSASMDRSIDCPAT